MARTKVTAKKTITSTADSTSRTAMQKEKLDAKLNPAVIAAVAANVVAKKKRRARPGMKALREIRDEQQSVLTIIPRAPFYRLVREIAQGFNDEIRFVPGALEALQQATEAFVVGDYMESTNRNAIHSKRVTIMIADSDLTKENLNASTKMCFDLNGTRSLTTMFAWSAQRRIENAPMNERRKQLAAEKKAAADAARQNGAEEQVDEQPVAQVAAAAAAAVEAPPAENGAKKRGRKPKAAAAAAALAKEADEQKNQLGEF